jgi:hypothetical protein
MITPWVGSGKQVSIPAKLPDKVFMTAPIFLIFHQE